MSVATALTVIFIPSIVRAQCGVISVPDSVTLRPGQSLSIRLFEFPSHQHEEYELFKKLPLTIAERLTATLQETKHFGSVETLLAGNPAQTDYVLEGRFVSLTATSSIPYLFVSEKLIGMAVQLQIRKPGAAQPMVELACLREKQTGLFGSEKKVVRRVAEMLVTDLGQLIPNITKELSLTASSDRSPTINAATQAMPDWWLYHPPKHWSSRRWKRSLRRDPTSITITGSAASPIEPSATVVAIWLTHENVLTALAGDRLTMIIKQYSEQKARGMATHDRKMAAVGEIYNALESDDQYFIWIWFAKRGPVFWRPDRTAAATFLRHHDALAERIQPLRFWISRQHRAFLRSI